MFSICIPVFNYDITSLVNDLHSQGELLQVPYEILLIDDASEKKYQTINESIKLSNVKYIALEKNIGRAKIRNLFLQHSQYNYLLFLDCDSAMFSENFLKTYKDLIENNNEYSVICGGRVCAKTPPKRNRMLRWKYGTYKENQPISLRKKSPNKSFMTNNFVIKKEVFKLNLFDETIVGYGHEDTLFGFHLKQKNISITPIENPILNADIETNQLFLQKTEEGIQNLHYIYSLVNYSNELRDDITILSFYEKLKKKKLVGIISLSFSLIKTPLKWFLLKGYFFLWMFDFYKLGILIHSQK